MIDPLGGSYYVEWLTEKMEEEAYRYFDRIERAGGILGAIKSGYLQKEIADNAYRLSRRVESGEDGVVGVNKYAVSEEAPISTLKIDSRAQHKQVDRIKKVRAQRDNRKVKQLLDKLRKSYEDPGSNSMYPLMEAVSAYATLGELVSVGREVFGTWREPQLI